MDHWARLEQGAKILKTIGTTLLKKKEQAMEVQARYQKMKASIGQFLEKNIHAFLNFRGFDFHDFDLLQFILYSIICSNPLSTTN